MKTTYFLSLVMMSEELFNKTFAKYLANTVLTAGIERSTNYQIFMTAFNAFSTQTSLT